MADVKISALTAAATLTGTELLPVVQGGVTVRSTTQAVADLALTAAALGGAIAAATAKATPVDADSFGLVDSAASNALKELTLAQLRAAICVTPLLVTVGDETTAITTGTAKVTLRMPFAFTLAFVRASLSTAQTSGAIFTVDINEGGTSILSTKLTIDNTEKTSTTAATAAVISDTTLADDAEITIDIDQVGDGTAKGLKLWLIGVRA